MAFGFPASYKTEVVLNSSRQSARLAARYAFEALGWEYTAAHNVFNARIPVNMSSWGEMITVSLENAGLVEITSKCGFPQIFDWGKNKQNVRQFLAHFIPSTERENSLKGGEPVYLDDEGNTPVERVLRDREPEPRV